MVKDVTPFPDQDQIRMDVARAKYHSKIDLSNVYEQVCVEPEDIKKTAFLTVFGTFLSQVMQQGDCNAPATFQWLMTVVLREYIDNSSMYTSMTSLCLVTCLRSMRGI